MAELSPSIHLVTGSGNFNRHALDEFVQKVRLHEAGLSYAVVAIVGPQSSGKSTLLNQLFGTTFTEMDALKGRQQTTQGIWMARAANIEPLTVVLDIEGTDSRERGEDDTAFERQSALFALAVADVILVNMWCHDIGREHASNKPLLKTVFQVMMRLFSPRKATLLFVIRDKTKTPMETLEPILRGDIQRIWDTVPKPPQHTNTDFSEFFNVLVTSLPNFEDREEEFKKQVASLRLRFTHSLEEGGLAGDRRGVVPAAGLALSLEEMWRVICDNKDLDLPAHKVMVATVRCEQIAADKIHEFEKHETWLSLRDVAMSDLTTITSSVAVSAQGFGRKVNELVTASLASYDAEAAFFDESVRTSKRHLLVSQLAQAVRPAYSSLLSSALNLSLASFRLALEEHTGGPSGSAAHFATSAASCRTQGVEAFDLAAADAFVELFGWQAASERSDLLSQMSAHEAAVKDTKLQHIIQDSEFFLSESLSEPVGALLESARSGGSSAWQEVRQLVSREVSAGQLQLKAALEGFELSEEAVREMEEGVRTAARTVVERKARELCSHALALMKERFLSVFSHDSHAMPRQWTTQTNIQQAATEARLAALQVLSALSVLRLENHSSFSDVDSAILSLLHSHSHSVHASDSAATTATTAGAANSNSINTSSGSSHPPSAGVRHGDRSQMGAQTPQQILLAGTKWEGVPSDCTLLSPSQCRSLWSKLKTETQYVLLQAMQAQEASRSSSSWLPPPWALVALVVLGFNEFMWLLRSPVTLFLLLLAYLFGRAVLTQMDVTGLFDHGVVSGVLALSTRVVPAVIRVVQRLVEEGGQQLARHTDAGGDGGRGRGRSDGGIAMQELVGGSTREFKLWREGSGSEREREDSSTGLKED